MVACAHPRSTQHHRPPALRVSIGSWHVRGHACTPCGGILAICPLPTRRRALKSVARRRVQVDEDFIADDFNLAGLSSQVPYYEYALSMMLDADSPNQDALTAEQSEYVESASELLYGLVHQRFILTSKGLAQMLDKYRNCHFGRCPRVGCNGQPCLPVGTSDQPRVSTVKVFCPKCEEIYYPRSYYQGNLDGAFFGTTFPHLLLLTYPAFRPAKARPDYTPRIFGFKIHPTAFGDDKERNAQPGEDSEQDAAAADVAAKR